jgi:predicted phosphodiesterase
VRTVVISDLHLGVRAGNDIARAPEVRPRLVEVVRGADRLVLLGDVFELRERPLADALAIARPLVMELAAALDGGEMVIVPGNHDHGLVGKAASRPGSGAPDQLERRLPPRPGDPLGRLASELAPARLELAYPGLWLDRGVYATHGHYLDVHSRIPMVECLAIAVSARLHDGRPGAGSTTAHYERIVAPVYRASTRLGRAGETLGRAGRGDFSVRLYERLASKAPDAEHVAWGGEAAQDASPDGGQAAPSSGRDDAHQRRLAGSLAGAGDRLLEAGVPALVRSLNRLGLGPFDTDLSGRALRRAGLDAMGAVVRSLELDADHVIFGHTHRPGPLGDEVEGWTVPARDGRAPTRLLNTGSWVYEPAFLASRPSDSPYWPGRCVVVEEGSAPMLAHPLADAGHEELSRTA